MSAIPAVADAPAALRLPDFLILGEMKCGTTTLWELMQQHPAVYFPEEKELHFFGSYGRFSPCGRLDSDGLEPYARRFAAAGAERRAGEATPNYLADAGACERIRRALGPLPLIAILRDPAARAWSHYWHNVRRGREPLSFERALAAEPQRVTRGPDDFDAYGYAARGRYVEGLRRYEAAFGRDRLLVVTLDDLRRDAASVAAAAWAHIGLEPLPRQTSAPAVRNRAKYPRSAAVDRLTRRGRAVAERCGPLIAAPARALGRWTRPWRTYSGQPRMAEDLRQRLADLFEPSDAELAAWLGRPLPWRLAADAHGSPA